jgi:hypothetical protein
MERFRAARPLYRVIRAYFRRADSALVPELEVVR